MNNDYISRQAAVDALRTCYDTDRIDMDNGDEYIDYNDAVGEIEALPSVQSMRKKGKWHKQDNGQIYWYECSICGCEPLRNKWNGEWELSDFCPHCGAEIRGEQDE